MIDHELLFADGQTLTNAAAGAIVADLEQAENADLSSLPFFAVVCQTDIEGTIQPKLQHSDTRNGTYTDCAVGAIAEAPKAGTTLLVPTPVKTKRFIRAYFDGTPQGKVSAFLTWGRQAWTAVPEDEKKEESGDEGGGGEDIVPLDGYVPATLTVGEYTFNNDKLPQFSGHYKGYDSGLIKYLGGDTFGSLVVDGEMQEKPGMIAVINGETLSLDPATTIIDYRLENGAPLTAAVLNATPIGSTIKLMLKYIGE